MKDDITPKKDMNRIEDLDRELYDPTKKHGQRPRRRIHGRNIELEHDFVDDEYEELIKGRSKYTLPTSLFKKIFFAVLAFFIVTLTVTGISLYEGKKNVSEDLIAMEILGQPFVDGGEALELQVLIQNFNERDLQLPDLVLSYPKDSAVDAERVFMRRSLPDIAPGQRVTEQFDLVLFGQEGDTRGIEATLEYRIEGSSSIFIKEITHEVIIRSTPTDILVDAPTSIVRNQEINFGIDVTSNSTNRINDAALKVTYPRGFEFLDSSVPPDFNNNTWYFNTVDTTPRRIEFIGRMAALEGQGQSFNIEFGKQNQSNRNQLETVFNSVIHTVDVQKSFINAELLVNNTNEPTSAIRGGSDTEIIIRYENTLPDALDNAVITVNLDGQLYDRNRVNVQDGFYNSSTQSVVFDQTTKGSLRTLQPGERGELRFTVSTRPLVGATGVLTNPSFDISIDVAGTETNGLLKEAQNIASHTVYANSDIAVIPKLQYNEGSFNNTGPIPPKADIPTTYTLVFSVSNSSNDVSDAELTTVLPTYIKWLNNIAPSVERNNVSYNTATREMTWEIGRLPSGVGVGSNQPQQLSVQIELTPSISQIGTDLDMTSEILLTGFDEFTETKLNFRKGAQTSHLQEEGRPTASGRVTE